MFDYLQSFILDNDLEYVDFMEYGWSDVFLKNSGFRKNSEKIFVPHHFEPFDPQKIDVTIAFSKVKENLYVQRVTVI